MKQFLLHLHRCSDIQYPSSSPSCNVNIETRKAKPPREITKYRLINANQKEKLYIVAVDTVNSPKTMYFKRKNPHKLSVFTSTKDALKFTTEKAAQAYIDKVLTDNYPAVKAFRVEKIEENNHI